MLARFQNGLLYRFIRGRPATNQDIVHAPLWRGVARRLGQWHAVLPLQAATPKSASDPSIMQSVDVTADQPSTTEADFPLIQPRQPGPNMWTVLQKWVLALPTATEEQQQRRRTLQKELERVVKELDDGKGLGENGVRRRPTIHASLAPKRTFIH